MELHAYSTECHCAAVFSPSPLYPVERQQCSSVCTGDATEICGGPTAYAIYQWNLQQLGPKVAQVDGWTYNACYVDSATRTLPGTSSTAADMTPAKCGALCFADGWTRFGIENANECWCSNAALNAALLAADQSTCDMACIGDATTVCGGGWRITTYSRTAPVQPIASVPGWTYSNCYVDADTRSLPTKQPDDATMTPAKCAALCTGRNVFGIEYGVECYCGDTISTSLIASDPTTCNVACGGQSNFVCGGGWRLTVYTRTPPVVQQVAGWQSVGCVSDSATRTLTGAVFGNQADITPAKCATLCTGSKYFGVENGNECYCGNTLPSGLTAPAGDCSFRCTGNDAYQFGGGWRLNVYQVLSSTTSTTQTSTKTSTTSTASTASTTSTTATTSTTSTKTSTSSTTSTASTTSTTLTTTSITTPPSTTTATTTPVICDTTPPTCDLPTCQGTVTSNTATCKLPSKLNCPCNPTASTPGFSCGTPQSCDAGGCAGDWDASGTRGVCKGNYAGCGCTPTGGMCGAQKACDAGGCDGGWDASGTKGVCQGAYAGCACTPTSGMCGVQQGCDQGGCDGGWDASGTKGVCKGNYAGCGCKPTGEMCGGKQACDQGGCNGWWDGTTGVCFGNYAGCGCNPTADMCGQQQSCDDGGCNGGWTNGVAICQAAWAGCRCSPTAKTCGQMASCDDGGCQGSFDYMSNTARCRA